MTSNETRIASLIAKYTYNHVRYCLSAVLRNGHGLDPVEAKAMAEATITRWQRDNVSLYHSSSLVLCVQGRWVAIPHSHLKR